MSIEDVDVIDAKISIVIEHLQEARAQLRKASVTIAWDAVNEGSLVLEEVVDLLDDLELPLRRRM